MKPATQPSRASTVAVMGAANMNAPAIDPEIARALSEHPPEVRRYVQDVVRRKEAERP